MLTDTTEMLKLTDALIEERTARLSMEQHLADIHEALRTHKHDTKNVLASLKMSLYLIQRDTTYATPERLEAMNTQLNKLTDSLETALNKDRDVHD